MPNTVRAGLLTGLVLSVLALPALASAAPATTPGAVTVEVAGGAGILIPQTSVTTTTAPVVKGSTGSCTGTSAAGALEQATAGAWTATDFGGDLGYSVDSIKGEAYLTTSNAYWAFYVNGIASSTGVCGAELHPGDRVQFYPSCTTGPTSCYYGEPMQLTAPATAAPGAAFTVSLTKSDTTYNPDYTSSTTVTPASGVSVGGATTGAGGTASVTLTAPGVNVITATQDGRPPASAQVCVTTGSDGLCGTTKPGDPLPPIGPGVPCATNGHDGLCGFPDKEPPLAKIAGITSKQRFTAKKAPRLLKGTVASVGSPIKVVRARLTRTSGKKCATYSGAHEKFLKAKCGWQNGRWFTVGTSADWSYLLPAKLAKGVYVLATRATDTTGNRDNDLVTGRNQITFTVK